MLGKNIIAGLAVISLLAVAGCGGGGLGITFDNTDPTMVISGIADGDTFHDFLFPTADPHIVGVAADDSGIASYTLKIDDVLVDSNNGPNLSYDWDWNAIPYGTHELKFQATDGNGNTKTVVYNVVTSFL